MKRSLIIVPVLLVSLPLAANEALDLLEGKKDINEIDLPPLPEEERQAGAKVAYVPPEWAPSPLDPIWSRAVLFENEKNPWVQQLAIMGLFEFSGSWGDARVTAGRDVDLNTTRTRRARLGARMRVFGNTEIEAVGEFAGNADYQRLERLKAKTRVRENYYVEYGKFKPRFGIEGSKEPHQLLTPERTLLANMLMPAATLGVSFSQECAPWDWRIGWFSGDNDRYIPGVSGDGFLAGSLAYESGEALEGGGAMRTRWHMDYIFNIDGASSDSIPRYDMAGRRSANGNQLIARNPSFRHMFSTGIELESERFAFEGDFQLANGDLNAWGMTLTPSYWAIPGMLKLVGRYHYADTNDPSGLVGGLGVGSDPFYDTQPLFVGDEFHSFYLGANLHLYQDKVTVLNGLEYALMKDDAGGFETDTWIWHSGARISF